MSAPRALESDTRPSAAPTALLGRPRFASPTLLGLLTAAAFVVQLDTRAVAPLLPAIAQDLGVGVATAGLMVTAYNLPFAVVQVIFGPLGDRFGRVRTATGAFGLFIVGTGLTSLAPTMPALLGVRVLAGSVAAGVYPLTLAYIGDSVPYARRQAAVGFLAASIGIAQVLSVSVGGVLGDVLSWRVLYELFAVVAVAVWLALLRGGWSVPPPPRREATGGALEQIAWQYREVYRTSGAVTLFALVFAEMFLVQGGFAYIGAALHDRFELSLAVVGLLLTGYGVGAFITARYVGQLAGRFGERRLVLGGGLLMGAGFLVSEFAPWWPANLPAVVLMGVGYMCSHTTIQTRMTDLSTRARGTALSMHAFYSTLGVAVGAAALGALLALTGGYDAVLLTSGAGLLLFGLVGGAYLPTGRRTRP